jgi:hypothetical protein
MTDVSEELSASIRATRIGELGTTLAAILMWWTELKEPGNGVMVPASKEERKGTQ